MAAAAMAHCRACDLEIEPDADRCPKCLRKSTLAPTGELEPYQDEEDHQPLWIGARALVALVALALGGIAAWRMFAADEWLRAHGLWIPAILVSLGLVTMPIRVAFRMDSEAKTAREALRFYAFSTLAVDGFIALFAACVAVASLFLGESIAVLPVGLFAFFMMLVATPVVVVAVKRPHELSATLKKSGKMALVLGGVVLGGTCLVMLSVASHPEPRKIVIFENPKDILDPLDLEHVAVDRSTTRNADGTTTRHLRADGGDIKRTLLKLDVVSISAVDEAKRDPSASGLVSCWVPARLRTPDAEAELAKEQTTMDHVMKDMVLKTPSGRAVRVVFAFGEPPT